MKFLLIFGVWLVLLAGCSSNQVETPPEYVPSDELAQYKIGAGDSLDINVWRNPELSKTVAVRPDGFITLPLVGDVQASGLTAQELNDSLTEKLLTFIKSPKVTVIVTNANSANYLMRVRVTGAVNNPLTVVYRDGMTVIDVILEAGGPTEFAALNNAKLYRKVGGEVKVYKIRLNDIINKGKLETNYQLAPTDIITVPERIL